MPKEIKLYTGKPVKSKKKDGKFEIITIDDISYSVWCRPINSIDNKLVEINIDDLIEV